MPTDPLDPQDPPDPTAASQPTGADDTAGPPDPTDPDQPGGADEPVDPTDPEGTRAGAHRDDVGVDVAAGEVERAGVRGRVDPSDQEVAPNVKAEHGGPRVPDRTVAWRIFAGIGTFVVAMAAIYWFTSYEDAGSVLLLLAAGLSLWFGTYLWLQQRRPVPALDPSEAGAEAVYLPHASIWPLVIGLGAASIANGLVLGIWVIVPGAAALVLGIGGFVRQSRRRD